VRLFKFNILCAFLVFYYFVPELFASVVLALLSSVLVIRSDLKKVSKVTYFRVE